MLRLNRILIRFVSASTTASATAGEVRTVKTPVGIKAAIESLKPKATRVSMDGPVECPLTDFALLKSLNSTRVLHSQWKKERVSS